MPIPDYQSLMLPFLRLSSDGEEHRFRDVVEQLAAEFKLTDEERSEMLPSGASPRFNNRVGWSKTYLKQARLLESPKRGVFQITDRGRALLNERPARIDVALLNCYEEFRAFRARRRDRSTSRESRAQSALSTMETPEDALASAYEKLEEELEAELLEHIKSTSPMFFERLVVELLVKMGYGGSREDAGHAIGRSGDEGIDGIIKEDRLGLDVIYVQAKRWNGTVGRPEIQRFAGALQGHQARKGVFITTSSFSQGAKEFAGRIDSKVILIDGERLAELMVVHNVGVSTVGNYEVKKIDLDYFEGE